uniref:Uncharacterized protein n=1 Tax=Triticum urartu TaxID=4572 RepID=A0A8R7UAG7_TRIUA
MAVVQLHSQSQQSRWRCFSHHLLHQSRSQKTMAGSGAGLAQLVVDLSGRRLGGRGAWSGSAHGK